MVTQPITDTQLKNIMKELNEHYDFLTKRIVYGHSLTTEHKGVTYVENTLMENAQAHIREAAVAIGRIIVNRVGDK